MMHRTIRGIALILLGVIALPLTGCGGSDAPTEVKFPDISELPKPTIIKESATKTADGPVSQGDPSQYSQAK